jgi:hypothetical protein
MISRALASALLAARHQASFMSLGLDADDRPDLVAARCDLGVAQLARSSARPDPCGGGARFAISRADMDVAAKPDDVGEAQPLEIGEQLGVAEAAIGQDRHRDALGQNLSQTSKAEVLIVVALVFQFVLQDGQPQQRRRPAVVGDQIQGQRRLIVGVKIGPVHGHDDRLALANDFRHPRGEHVPHDNALIAQQPIDLLDGVLAEQAARLSQGLADDRHRQRCARHHAERAIGQRLHTLRMEVFGEYAVEIVLNEINALAQTVHGAGSS